MLRIIVEREPGGREPAKFEVAWAELGERLRSGGAQQLRHPRRRRRQSADGHAGVAADGQDRKAPAQPECPEICRASRCLVGDQAKKAAAS